MTQTKSGATPQTMRTQEEIAERIKSAQAWDFLNITAQDLIGFLDFEHAKPWLKPETTAKDWAEPEEQSRDKIVERIKDYIPFAIMKARDQRGISAGRSMIHFSNWTWLIGDQDKLPNLVEYSDYGMPHIKTLCEFYGFSFSELEEASQLL